MKVFVGFFGLPRGWKFTKISIVENILKPLQIIGADTFLAAHFNEPDYIYAPRSNEFAVPFSVGDLSCLNLNRLIVERQTSDMISPYEKYVLSVPFLGEDDVGFYTRRNSLYQLYSLSMLAKIFCDNNPWSFDAVILLRPDMRYIDKIPMKKLLSRFNAKDNIFMSRKYTVFFNILSTRADIITAETNRNGGLNDRFAFLSPNAALIYMNRIEKLREFCCNFGYYHPERFLHDTIKRAGLKSCYTWVRAERVRSDGSVASLDIPGLRRKIYNFSVLPVRRLL